jgi:uncharacterized Tic20 family protein
MSDFTKDDKTMAMLAHLSGLLFSVVGPLVIWAIKKDESTFVREHSLEAINFQISMIIYAFAAGISMIFLIGFLLLPALILAEVIVCIMAAMAANKGEMYKYPFTLRLIS